MNFIEWLQRLLGGLPNYSPLAEDGPDDLPTLRRIVTDLGSQNRQLMIERDCYLGELLRSGKYTRQSLANRVKMYDRALRARVRLARAAS